MSGSRRYEIKGTFMQFPRSRVQYLCDERQQRRKIGVRHGFPMGQQKTFPERLHLVFLLAR
jgi:hypothetical protein